MLPSWCLQELEDLDTQVVPGVSCFNAANAALKKDILASGPSKATVLTTSDWTGKNNKIGKMADKQVNMVIFPMGACIGDLVEKLAYHYSPDTSVAIVCSAGNKEREKVINGSMQNIMDKVQIKDIPRYEYLVYVSRSLGFQGDK